MKNSKKHLSIMLILALLTTAVSAYLYFKKDDFKILETSVLSILQDIAQEYAPEPPDLSIDKITVRKTASPKDDFNYTKYTSTVIIHNNGGPLANARLVLGAGDNQKFTLVKNTKNGFTLGPDETYIVRNYELLFNGNYNGGTVKVNLDLTDHKDYDDSNNYYYVDLFDAPSKIKSIELDEVLSDGTHVANFDSIPYAIRKHDFSVLQANSLPTDNFESRYREVETDDGIYGYHLIKNSPELAEGNFEKKEVSEIEAHFLKLEDDPFLDDETNYVYIKAVNPETDQFAISNILSFGPQDEMTRSELAKLFVEAVDLEGTDEGITHFSDINHDEWYAPYVQTLYDLGLFDLKTYQFNPGETVSRGEVLKMVLEYFDTDLQIKKGAPHFEDVAELDEYYAYAEALYATGNARSLSENLRLEAPATRDYLNYLIYEYSKAN